MSWWEGPTRVPNPIDPTLNRITILFRVLGWAWMALLVVIGLSSDDITQPLVAGLTLALATIWTGVTLWAARDDRRLKSPWFVATDVITALIVGGTAPGAGTDQLFHGGYPMSSVLVVANAGGFRWAWPASLILGVEQFFVRLSVGYSVQGATFAVVFPFIAIVAGFGFDALREQSARRSEVEAALAESQAVQARLQERAELANLLHDSVLQTLHAIQVEASNPHQVTYLARRQERELKRTIEQFRSPHEQSFRVALMAVRDEVEDLHNKVKIDALVKDDFPLDPRLSAMVEAAREAMLNSARHSGAAVIDVYSERRDTSAVVIVRDRGVGFEPTDALSGATHGLEKSLLGRVHGVGGDVDIASSPGAGTEVTITVPYPSTPIPR